jgi:hypothetical protein
MKTENRQLTSLKRMQRLKMISLLWGPVAAYSFQLIMVVKAQRKSILPSISHAHKGPQG